MVVNRRKFMRLATAGLSSALVPLVGCARQIGQQRGSTHYPTPSDPLTPIAAWYYMSIQGAYEADEARYRLKMGGVTEHALSLSVAALRDEFAPATEMVTMACVGNDPGGVLRSSAYFRGVPLRDVMARAGVKDRASGAYITGLDGFVSYQDIDDLRHERTMLAYEMGTSPDELSRLAIDHGFPCRLLTPGKYGYMQPKWIDSITFVDQGGYGTVVTKSIPYFSGSMQLASGFSNPRAGTLDAGPLELLGYAFGDGRPITKVELRSNGGAWSQAAIVYNDGSDELPDTLWVLWRWQWEATAGTHNIEVRASYADGETQAHAMRFPYSGGSITSIDLTIRDTEA